MGFVIVLLTVLMLLDCVVMVALILIQLPKKDTGGGLAFGGSASDALFGAGSGNVLTKVTKYAAGIFFGLMIVLAVLQRTYHSRASTEFEKQFNNPTAEQAPRVLPAPATIPPGQPAAQMGGSNVLGNLPMPTAPITNAPAAPSNSAPAPSAPK